MRTRPTATGRTTGEIDPKDFYRQLREGDGHHLGGTMSDFTENHRAPHLKEGRDVLVVAFSSGLSATCHSAQIAAQELSEQYPERKVYAGDSLRLTPGPGPAGVVRRPHEERGQRGIGAVRDWLEENKLHLCHWFTVDDLHFLKRGGCHFLPRPPYWAPCCPSSLSCMWTTRAT